MLLTFKKGLKGDRISKLRLILNRKVDLKSDRKNGQMLHCGVPNCPMGGDMDVNF